ncbi:flagellar FlbD family protein [Modestobacter roseus]|uniref:Flagellar protein FlbD n=1 Tax=Modestobacter roseus TaxID=1181884 RepID=A0A562IL88_9ACTN|nr:flagellar FlbD family protein [Modestobacter roseus]MQA34540.1 flagellar protein FlbD [Modestobacter roseus]TWH71596.1 flagellar protein FlbD [Modestobacter roseus]
MIRLTRLNGKHFVLNAELVQRVEGHPDTVITLADDTKYVVTETVDEVVEEIRTWHASVRATSFRMDRGELHLTTPYHQQGTDDSSVVPFPSRDER